MNFTDSGKNYVVLENVDYGYQHQGYIKIAKTK